MSFAAWYPSAQVTAQLSPMVQEAQSDPDKEPLSKRSPMEHVGASQVGYGSVGSLTKAPSEPPVKPVEAAVPEIAALPYEHGRCRTLRRLCSGSRDSPWKEA